MFELFFGDKVVFITSRSVDDAFTVEASDAFDGTDPGTAVTKIIEKLENHNTVAIKTDDPQQTFEWLTSGFVCVEAAGGLVRNRSGNILMIFRNGRWDLPKGHIDPGEDARNAAVREVAEETAVHDAEITGELIPTYHFYELAGEWVLKRTWWYEMKSYSEHAMPQREEGITAVEWVPWHAIKEYATTCFSSVKKVLDAANAFCNKLNNPIIT